MQSSDAFAQAIGYPRAPVDDLLVFQSETRNTLYALMWVVGIVAVLALVFGIAIVYH